MNYNSMAKWLLSNWDAPARAYFAQSPTPLQTNSLLGNLLLRAHQAIDPVNSLGGYGGLLGMALPPGSAPKRFVPAMKIGNELLIGNPGQIHAELVQDRHWGVTPKIYGFADETGRFYTREEAASAVDLRKASPDAHDPSITGDEKLTKLHAWYLDLANKQLAGKR